jgi:hypothetical protein
MMHGVQSKMTRMCNAHPQNEDAFNIFKRMSLVGTIWVDAVT